MIVHSSVSILNAIPSGIGAVIPIKLYFKSEITEGEFSDPKDLEVLKIAFNYSKNDIKIKKESEIPIGVGLKSSSAYTSSIVGAFSQYMKLDMDNIEIARLSAKISIKLGISITGAFDDAIGSLIDKIPVTDNRGMEILDLLENLKMPVIISIPELKRPKDMRERLLLLRSHFQIALEYLRKGDMITCANMNGYLVGKALGYPLEPVINVRKMGALISGYTGNGPSMFAVVEKGHVKEIAEYMSKFGKIIVTGGI